MLGYPSHSHFKLETKMAKNPKNVLDFLQNLKERLQPLAKNEIKKLLELKKAEKEELNQPYDGVINDWDFHYYNRLAMIIFLFLFLIFFFLYIYYNNNYL